MGEWENWIGVSTARLRLETGGNEFHSSSQSFSCVLFLLTFALPSCLGQQHATETVGNTELQESSPQHWDPTSFWGSFSTLELKTNCIPAQACKRPSLTPDGLYEIVGAETTDMNRSFD